MDGRMDDWMDAMVLRRTDGQMVGRTDKWMGGWYEWMDGRRDGRTDARMNGWTNGRADVMYRRRMNGINGCMYVRTGVWMRWLDG